MDIQSVKILLNLLDKSNYQTKVAQVKPNKKITVPKTRDLCQKLSKEGYLKLETKIVTIKITHNGKKILNNKSLSRQYSSQQLKILTSCKSSPIKITNTKIYPASKRDKLIQQLKKEKAIAIKEREITKVSLTDKALFFLAEEMFFIGKGNFTLSKKLINTYLKFIRGYNLKTHKIESTKEAKIKDFPQNIKPNKEDVLETIIKLDKDLNSGNYLPIFYLRDEYNTFDREELDNILYTLENEGKISMSTLVNASKYTKEQYDAGIKQFSGGPLFYLMIEEN